MPSNKLALYYGKRELVSIEKPRINQSGNNISGDDDGDGGVDGGDVEGDDDCLEDGYNKEREGERVREKRIKENCKKKSNGKRKKNEKPKVKNKFFL